jgi:hypothetical protein
VFNKDIKVPLQEAELVGTSSSNNVLELVVDIFGGVVATKKGGKR